MSSRAHWQLHLCVDCKILSKDRGELGRLESIGIAI